MKIPDKPRPSEDSGYLPLKPASLHQRAIEKSLFKVLKDIDYMPSRHTSFQCSETGLLVYEDIPYLAASPDGITECKCCGRGLLEIKCPFNLQQEISQVAMSKNSSCILIDGKNK